MYQNLIRAAVGLSAAAALWAQPAIYPHGVVNAASLLSPGLPGSAIAQGSAFTIYGAGIGPATGVQVSSFPLATTLSGVSIAAVQGDTTINVLPLYVRQDQINALMPSNAPLGWVSLRITYNNAKSNPSPVFVVRDSPGIYTFTGTGLGPGAMQIINSDGSLPLNSNQASAKPGQSVQLYLTGLGPISAPDNQPPPAGNLSTSVEVWVGGVLATVAYSGRSPCCSGLDQIVFTVPANSPPGCWVPVQIRTSKANISNSVSMAINTSGGPCSDPANPLSSTIVNGGTMGSLSLTRTTIHQDVGVNAPVDLAGDSLWYSANKLTANPFAFRPFASAPPPGTCAVYAGIGDYWASGKIGDATVATSLDTGKQFTITGPGGPRAVTLTNASAPVGSYIPLYSLPSLLFLGPGNFTISGGGGADVGAVNLALTVPAPFTWTNRDQITKVDRTQPLTLTWSGTSGQAIQIVGENSDLPTNSSALFNCLVPAGATSFTVPPQVLAALPGTRSSSLNSTGVIFVMSSTPGSFSVPGLNTAFASAVYSNGKTVILQ